MIICVGDPNRAELLSTLLDSSTPIFCKESNRGFKTYTGTYKGKRMSIMAIGMGIPMADFFVREVRYITEGPLAVIRLGTCGTPREDINIGTLALASQSVCVTTNYNSYSRDHSENGRALDHFTVSKPCYADSTLTNLLKNHLASTVVDFPVVIGLDITADSFYSSQGRVDANFDDRNATLIDELITNHPQCVSLQMETFHLLHLARLSFGKIYVAACAIVLAQRRSNAFLDNKSKHNLELLAGKACLNSLFDWTSEEKN